MALVRIQGRYIKLASAERVETAEQIFMVETKARNELQDAEVIEKANAARVYCQAASEWDADHGGKPWIYALLSHDEVRINPTLIFL